MDQQNSDIKVGTYKGYHKYMPYQSLYFREGISWRVRFSLKIINRNCIYDGKLFHNNISLFNKNYNNIIITKRTKTDKKGKVRT